MKTVLITGASSGIGRATAELFAKNDWKTLLVARNEEKLKSLSATLSHSEYFICDLTCKESLARLTTQLKPHLKGLKALVNNAGIYEQSSMEDDSDEAWEGLFNSNLMSAVRLTRVLWPTLKNNKGSILNISSTLAIRPIPNAIAYSALKAAMNNWTMSLAIEGAPFGINANCICPGLVDTPIHGFHGSDNPEMVELKNQLQNIQPIGRIGTPNDIAGTAVHLCSEEAQWTTGTIHNIDGGILLNS